MTQQDDTDKPRSSPFRSAIVDEARLGGNVLNLPGGQIILPRVFGFCRGVERALEMLQRACDRQAGGRFFLLGQIIHNPWVNRYFEGRGVQILGAGEIDRLEELVRAADCAVIPAFGVRPDVMRRLRAIGCQVVDTSCGDVRRLWAWAQRASREGCGVMVFGRADHDETVVTKNLLAECPGGRYVIAGSLEKVAQFCRLVTGEMPEADFVRLFDSQSTNSRDIAPFGRLAQVSQTTMLYSQTMTVRRMLTEAFERRFGADEAARRLSFQPTVCRATQDRQAAAVELCQSRPDVTIVVGGFGSSNTRHLYELARQYSAAYFIEDATAIRSADVLSTVHFEADRQQAGSEIRGWLPAGRPLRIAVLAGASTPESVVGEVIDRLAGFLR